MGQIKAPIKYFGGKGNMIGKILQFFPEKGSYNVYIEPFGGSYSVGMSNPDNPEVQIYNDLEKNVYSLYKVISDPELFRVFKEKCDLTYFSEDIRYEMKSKLKDETISIVDRAHCFFSLNRMSRNGIGGITTNIVVRRNMSKSVSDYLSAIDRLPEIHQFMSKVMVFNRDALEFFEKYNSPNVFIYCDPPYVHSTRTSTRYSVDMTDDQHLKFLDLIMKSSSKILVSGYDNEYYDILSSNGFTKHKFDVKTITGTMEKKTKTETIWKNY